MLHLLRGFGRVMVTLGLLILLFVAYQLWGTGIWTARAQDDLESDFERAQAAYDATAPTTGPGTAPPDTTPDPPPLPPLIEGETIGGINIPAINHSWWFVEGTSRADLKKGPGHYIGTPLPGQLGNAAIAGHRTTYGAPFNRLDELEIGDEIIVTTVVGEWKYRVRETPFAVKPSDTYVVAPTYTAELTLTTCHPKNSARERLIVKADLVVDESSPAIAADALVGGEPPPAAPEGDVLDDAFAGDRTAHTGAYGWGAIAMLVGLAWWWAFRRWRHPLTWAAGVMPFLVVLFGFYYFLERALPPELPTP
ncbi:MAG: class E sortase [Actinomycetota bacterium]